MRAYAGLAVMSDTYNSGEFAEIKYFNTSSTYACPDNGVRKAYYGISATPHLVWQGQLEMIGAGTNVMDGSVYDPIVLSNLAMGTPFALSISNVSFTGAPQATITVELDDAVADVSDHFIRAFIVEDGLNHSGVVNSVHRDMITQTPVTITGEGEIQVLNLEIPINPTWNTDNLRIIAIVQRDTDKLILQGATSEPVGVFAFRYYVDGERVVVESGEYEFGDVEVFNVGARDNTLDLTLDASNLPAGWSAWITDGVSTWPTTTSVAQIPGDRSLYNVVIDAPTSGYGTVELTIHSQNGGTSDRVVTFSTITADNEILVVDNDQGQSYETDYIMPALSSYPRNSAVWDRSAGAPSASILANFKAVIWETGESYAGSFDESDRAAVAAYLEGGGALFATGQDIGYEMNEEGGAAYLWYRNYLHALFVTDDTNRTAMSGVDGDPVSNGLAFNIAGGDGANNQEYPSAINPYNGSHVILTYDGSTQNGAVAVDTGVYRMVYFAFGFEGISTAANRTLVMDRVLDWLIPDLTGIEDTPMVPFTLSQNVPNPFNPNTKISFNLGQAGDVKLSVFDAQGRLVKVLEEGKRASGEFEVMWDGRNADGATVSSGLYFYRLDAAGETQTKKMMMLK
ncbi:MAG: T9SS type A sorting domain-containing protein [bacterium]|nr:T9SS type A sorting domain-containing protein [bacterium]